MTISKVTSSTESSNVKNYAGFTNTGVIPVVPCRLDGHPLGYPGGSAAKGLSKFLRDGASSNAMNVDGSVTPVTFTIKPPANTVYEIASLRFVLMGGAMQMQQFGSQAVLANGITIGLFGDVPPAVDVQLLDFLDGETVKSLDDFMIHMTESGTILSAAAGDDVFLGSILFTQNLGLHVTLDGDNNESIKMTINDNLTTQASFRCKAVGFESTKV